MCVCVCVCVRVHVDRRYLCFLGTFGGCALLMNTWITVLHYREIRGGVISSMTLHLAFYYFSFMSITL